MTAFSITDQFNELVQVTLSEKQALTEQTDNNIDMINKSAKSQDFFQNNKPSERKYTTARIHQEIFYLTLLMLVLVNWIFTMKILFLTFIC